MEAHSWSTIHKAQAAMVVWERWGGRRIRGPNLRRKIRTTWIVPSLRELCSGGLREWLKGELARGSSPEILKLGVILNKESGICISPGVCSQAKPATYLLLPECEKHNRNMEWPPVKDLSKDCSRFSQKGNLVLEHGTEISQQHSQPGSTPKPFHWGCGDPTEVDPAGGVRKKWLCLPGCLTDILYATQWSNISLSPAHDCPWQAAATAQKPMRKVGHLISPTPSPPNLYFGMGAQAHWISNREETQKFSSEIDKNGNCNTTCTEMERFSGPD